MKSYLTLALKTTVGWTLVCSVFYTLYFTSGLRRQTSQVREIDIDVRTVCYFLITDEDDRCLAPVRYYFRDSWRPPVWLWRTGWVTPYIAAAPFYFVPLDEQIVLIDPKYWGKLTERGRRGVIAHELGHVLFGWNHADDPANLMHTYEMHWDWISAFKVAYEENEK